MTTKPEPFAAHTKAICLLRTEKFYAGRAELGTLLTALPNLIHVADWRSSHGSLPTMEGHPLSTLGMFLGTQPARWRLGLPLYQSITHIDVQDSVFSWAGVGWLWHQLESLPALTHIAVRLVHDIIHHGEQILRSMTRALHRILAHGKGLRVCVVFELDEAQLPGSLADFELTDARYVLLKIEDPIGQWAHHVNGRRSFWDVAEEIVLSQRR